MKIQDPVFEFVDTTGHTRLVRIKTNYNQGFNLKRDDAVADVIDISSGVLIEKVPLASLVPVTHE